MHFFLNTRTGTVLILLCIKNKSVLYHRLGYTINMETPTAKYGKNILKNLVVLGFG